MSLTLQAIEDFRSLARRSLLSRAGVTSLCDEALQNIDEICDAAARQLAATDHVAFREVWLSSWSVEMVLERTGLQLATMWRRKAACEDELGKMPTMNRLRQEHLAQVESERVQMPPSPCYARPGSEERIESLAARAAAGCGMWHPDDLVVDYSHGSV